MTSVLKTGVDLVFTVGSNPTPTAFFDRTWRLIF